MHEYCEIQLQTAHFYLSERAVAFSGKGIQVETVKKYDDFIMYGKLQPDSDEWVVYGYYANGSVSKPHLIWGRFFQENEYREAQKLAVVGKSLLEENQIEEEHQKKYFVYQEEYYEVIGVMGYDVPTTLDRTVFLNISATNPDYLYCIDAKDGKMITEIMETLKSVDENITIMSLAEVDVNTIVNLEGQQDDVIYLLYGIIIVFLLFLCVLYIKEKRQEIYVALLMGVSVVHMLNRFFKELTVFFLIAFGAGILIYFLGYKWALEVYFVQWKVFSLLLQFVVLGLLFALFYGMGVMYYYLFRRELK